MEALRLEQIAAWCGGRLTQGDPKALALRICTDSRAARPGDCFIALKGERFDAHQFLAEVVKARATAAVISNASAAPQRSETAVIEVDDTTRALQRLAAAYRDSMPLKIVAVTGSNGKTTTKEMIAAVLTRKFQTAKNDGNLNNHIGVPLSLLHIGAADGVGVFEVGTNHPGEIALLASLVKPDVSVVTNIGMAHIEHFGTKAAIAEEKGALVAALGADGVAVLNADNEWTPTIARRCRGRVVTVGIDKPADIRARAVRVNGSIHFTLRERATRKKSEVELPMMGQHQIYNALQAAAVGREFGLELEEIVEGLKSVALPEMRMQLESIGDVRVFNDAYNANPDSMRAALETFRHLQATGRKIAVLGDMLELGNCAGIAHASVGEQVAKLKQVKLLITVGSLARLIGESAKRHGMDARQVMELETADEAAMFLKMCVHGGDCVLLKGSRRVGLERVVEVLREHNKEEEDSALGKRARANRTGLVSVCD